MLSIVVDPTDFDDWHTLYTLLNDAFAFMHGRIDPPSSLTRLDVDGLRSKAGTETLVLAYDNTQLVGCAFGKLRNDVMYVGKIAVHNNQRRAGIARRLIEKLEQLARVANINMLELETRIELVENHASFVRLGFVETAKTAHPGYSRPTAITMRKHLT